MKVLSRVFALVFVVVSGSACHAQNLGSMISADDYFEQFYSNGVLVPDRNIKVTFYQNAVEVQYYQKGTRNLASTSQRIIYYYDHTESNGEKVYFDNPNSFFRSKFTISNDGSTINRSSSVLRCVATRGFRDIQPQSSVPMGGNGYDNSNYYNNSSSSSSSSRGCGVCKGSGVCIGCNGSGFTKDPYGRDCPCGACTKPNNVPGKCDVCHGTGARTY